jgi:hypothetical protein
VAGSCGYGDELSGYGATELVKCQITSAEKVCASLARCISTDTPAF